ncbi:hypothetical protein DNTS_031620 [Danionella cerebrum]|uniref:Kinase n=1 Tax=Danionella cerebrum TaxID=2873325 RepID=A0A553QJN0_9TELE|nr:hypothetical protein DNTS_031620 [Danionella translucida]
MSTLSEKMSKDADGTFDFSRSSVGHFSDFRARPKLATAGAVLSSKLKEPMEIEENPYEERKSLECMEDEEEKKGKEQMMASDALNAAIRKTLWRNKIQPKERLKEEIRERVDGSPESMNEANFGDKQTHEEKSLGSKKKNKQTLLLRDGQHCIDGEKRERELVPHPVLSRVLFHSSASSSSFNNSSAESDEVFSESEDAATRRQTMKKCRSWRTFLTMMQWSKRTRSSWIQLAGHQGNVRLSEGGEVLKRFCEVEDLCLQALMSDVLSQFVPQYYGHICQDGERYIRLEDLLSGLKHPVIMDCKMGVRTYQEAEILKARKNPKIRTDMYQKMVKVDPAAPNAEEHAQTGITKLRYLQWRDDSSSTSSLGFRIEGIMTGNGKVLRDFYKTRTEAQVLETLLSFTRNQLFILEAYKSRLQALSNTLKQSSFFNKHEIIGSSLLFVHDHSNKANIWMIDFGKTVPTLEDVQLRHDVPWVEGNQEDGYLIGLSSLISLLGEAIKRAGEQNIEQLT